MFGLCEHRLIEHKASAYKRVVIKTSACNRVVYVVIKSCLGVLRCLLNVINFERFHQQDTTRPASLIIFIKECTISLNKNP